MALRHHHRRRLALLGCWLAALTAAGCGADDEPAGAPLPRAAVAELDKQLGSIEDRYAFGNGACADIEQDNLPSVRRALDRLPNSVDPHVRRALRQSFTRLFELARRQCDEHKPTTAPAAPTTPPAPPAAAPPVATATATATTPADTTPTNTTDTADTGATDSAETNTSKTTPRPPTTPKRTPRQRDRPNTERPPDKPGRTDGSAGSGSGGTPAPQPRRNSPES